MNEWGKDCSSASLIAVMVISGQSPPPWTIKSRRPRWNRRGSRVFNIGPTSAKRWGWRQLSFVVAESYLDQRREWECNHRWRILVEVSHCRYVLLLASLAEDRRASIQWHRRQRPHSMFRSVASQWAEKIRVRGWAQERQRVLVVSFVTPLIDTC